MVDAETQANWRKVKEALEKTGKTNCEFYRRACAVVKGQGDPFHGTRYERF